MQSLVWQLARRYRSTRHTSGFIRFISASSTLGIALGVAILILALSVMNGFEQALKQRLLAVIRRGGRVQHYETVRLHRNGHALAVAAIQPADTQASSR